MIHGTTTRGRRCRPRVAAGLRPASSGHPEDVATTYEVQPHGGVGPMRFGMSRAEVRAAMPAVPVAFGRQAGDAPVDAWHDFVLQVFYDAEDCVEYIEVERDEALQARLYDEAILLLPVDRALAHVCRHGHDQPEGDQLPYAHVFPALDLALWRPHDGEEITGCFASLGVARPGALASRFAREGSSL